MYGLGAWNYILIFMIFDDLIIFIDILEYSRNISIFLYIRPLELDSHFLNYLITSRNLNSNDLRFIIFKYLFSFRNNL